MLHYIIHACNTPSLAPDGLAAARHCSKIAASAPGNGSQSTRPEFHHVKSVVSSARLAAK